MRFVAKFMILILFANSCRGEKSDNINHKYSLSELIDSLNIDTAGLVILIDKSDYRLSVLYDTLIIKEYPVVFGSNPVDDKLQQGDQCTPEGTFKVITKYPHKEWSKFIWINYPNEESSRKHRAAKREGKIPADAKIGGEIGIHGVPDGMDILIDLKFNWTLGCVSLKSKDINEIYPFVSKTTKVKIQK
jgi:murein L,D-transpeptidase YafK